MDLKPLIFLLVFLFLLHYAAALRVLAIISLPLRSHYMAFQSLFRGLASRGHSVTVINNFPDENPVENLTFVDIRAEILSASGAPRLDFYENVDSSYLHLRNFYRHMGSVVVEKDCVNLFSSEGLREHSAAENEYDVVFVEQFMSDCALVYAAALYDAPIIGITSHVLLPSAYPRLGIRFDFAKDSFYFSKAGTDPSLFEKIENYVADSLFNTINGWILHRTINGVFNKYLPHTNIDVEDIARERMKMVFAYQHFSLTGARVMSPQILEIGGIHVGRPKPLSEDIARFLANAEHGAIYISFGSILKASTMSAEKLQQFTRAFSRIPQKVLWKWENETLPGGNERIMHRAWFPQLDVLCHPKVLAFISHGGMLSLSEATHCGKPVMAIPFFGDQFSNAAMVRASGLGITEGFQRLNTENLVEGIKELTSEKMQGSAKRISRLWHDRPQSAMDSAIYWTEYVARHKTAPPSLPSKHTTWFESTLLDVYSVLLVIITTFLFTLYVVLSSIMLIVYKLVQQTICNSKVKIQ